MTEFTMSDLLKLYSQFTHLKNIIKLDGYIDDYQLLATIGLKNDNMPYILDIASPPQHFVTGETIRGVLRQQMRPR